MQDESPYVPVLPEHPELRELALVIESAGMMGEILDPSFLCVFFSSESARAMGLSADEASSMIGKSLLVRGMTKEYAELARLTEDSGIAWFQQNAPIMRRFLEPGTPEFDEAFGTTAKFAAEIDPVEEAPRAWLDLVTARPHLRWQRTILGDQNQAQIRINDDSGRFIGILFLYRGTVPESLLHRLGRGDPGVFKRMERVSEPARRPAGILFADLEASGVLSRRLSSRGYFDLIRDLTDLIDSSVIARDGITGKHAGDGGSALFLAADFEGSESADAGAIPRRRDLTAPEASNQLRGRADQSRTAGAALPNYRDKVGFDLDHDTQNEHMHVAQLTPPGSGCSIVFGNLPAQNEMEPGSMKSLQLVVSDAAAARQELLKDHTGLGEWAGR